MLHQQVGRKPFTMIEAVHHVISKRRRIFGGYYLSEEFNDACPMNQVLMILEVQATNGNCKIMLLYLGDSADKPSCGRILSRVPIRRIQI